ncbi:MAG: nuclear transport factor 2 family protein [Chloroflexi bacterium]|nr:nuclear transport factor 2 family protein [Chloroflexota bacterium]
MTSERDPAIQELFDRAAIHDVIMRYCHGIDQRDMDLVRSCYIPDAYDDHGRFKGTGIDNIIAFFVAALKPYSATMHFIGNELIEVHGDTADSEAYCVAYHRTVNGEETRDIAVGLRYVDKFVRRDGRWLIAERVVKPIWSRNDLMVPPPVGQR